MFETLNALLSLGHHHDLIQCNHGSLAHRCLAALLPGLMSLRFALAGLGITREPRLVAGTAVSTTLA
jgi:hypothetical protein